MTPPTVYLITGGRWHRRTLLWMQRWERDGWHVIPVGKWEPWGPRAERSAA